MPCISHCDDGLRAGGGLLTDHYPEATKACWDIEGVYCCSRHIPGVRFAGLIHPCAELWLEPQLEK
jgi:acetamidase/formamidase